MAKTIYVEKAHKLSPRWRFVLFDGGTQIGGDVIDPRKLAEVERKLTRPYRVPAAWFVSLCVDGREPTTYDVPEVERFASGPITLHVRGREQPIETATSTVEPFDAVASADPGIPDALIYWDDERLCCLDIDTDAPIPEHVAAHCATAVRPRPAWWHRSRSGGLHLYYTPCDGFSGRELAAVAAVWVRQFDRSWRVELKQVTRHPAQTGDPLRTQTPLADVSHVRAWLYATADDAEAARWMETHGYELGRRYSHDRCPIEPRDTSGTDPVVVLDRGIYCHRCEGVGRRRGSHRPGFVPFSHLTNASLSAPLRRCVDHFTHWGQARIVVANQTGLSGPIAELCYRVLLSLRHGHDDARIDAAFAVAPDLVRRDGRWEYLDGSALKVAFGRRELGALPATQNAQGETIGPTLDRFCQGADLSAYGYEPIDVVPGCRVWGHWLAYRNERQTHVVYRGAPEHAPRYRPVKERMPEATAWATLEALYPGLNRGYLTLLLAARAFAEEPTGMPPLIYAYGTTGAGKSQTVNIAAAILGDANTDVAWSHDTQRWRQGILDAVSRGSYCSVNEVQKSAERVRMPMDLALEPVLTLTGDSTSHQMYVGPVRLGKVPVMVFTETSLCDAVASSEQLGRRMVDVELSSAVLWDRSPRPAELRSLNDDVRAACDALLSYVIDRYFMEPTTTFMDAATRIGFRPISARLEASRALMREFFREVCAAPEASANDLRRWGGPGWRRISKSDTYDDSNAMASLYGQFAGAAFDNPVRLLEPDWNRLLGVDPVRYGTVKLEVKRLSATTTTTVGVRFAQREPGSARADRVNGDIQGVTL